MSMWMCGAGDRQGLTNGQTDELGYATSENICNVHDLYATVMHLLGIEHEGFTVKY
jgi:hypothetical protein